MVIFAIKTVSLSYLLESLTLSTSTIIYKFFLLSSLSPPKFRDDVVRCDIYVFNVVYSAVVFLPCASTVRSIRPYVFPLR